jgi:hypothetical protein
MTGLAKELTVRDFVIAANVERFLVVELVGRESAVSVVRAPTRGALTGTPGSLSGQTLYRFGKTHAPSFRTPTFVAYQ